jgi:hypothetical protein
MGLGAVSEESSRSRGIFQLCGQAFVFRSLLIAPQRNCSSGRSSRNSSIRISGGLGSGPIRTAPEDDGRERPCERGFPCVESIQTGSVSDLILLRYR